jgi:hypothetical protein
VHLRGVNFLIRFVCVHIDDDIPALSVCGANGANIVIRTDAFACAPSERMLQDSQQQKPQILRRTRSDCSEEVRAKIGSDSVSGRLILLPRTISKPDGPYAEDLGELAGNCWRQTGKK